MRVEASSRRARILGDARVPPWASCPEVAEALDQADAGDVVFVQRRRDGVVIVAMLPLSALAPQLRELLERAPAQPELGAIAGYRFRRWLVTLDADGSARVFEKYGEQTSAGYEKGVDKSSSGPQRAVDRMAPDAPSGAGGGTATGSGKGGKVKASAAPARGSAPVVNVYINAGGDGAKHMGSPQFLSGLTKAIEDALENAGLGPQAAPES